MKQTRNNLFSILLVIVVTTSVQAQSEPATESGSAKRIAADSLFQSERLVEINFELDEKDWDILRFQSRSIVGSLGRTPADSPFTYVKANMTIDGKMIQDVGIRKKGFLGSLDDIRPSLKIKFSEFREQDPIDGVDRLTLNNNKQDPACVGQLLAYRMYNRAGTISPRCGLAKVTVNGQYLGIYSNVESIKPPFLARGFGDGSGDLFEGTVADFYPEWVKKFEKKNKQASRDQIRELADLLAADEVDLEKLDTLVDIDAFLRFWATESLLGFWDGYCHNQNNFFVYSNPANSKFYFIPWGLDSSFASKSLLPPYRIRPKSVHAKAILPNKLYRIPEIQDRYLATLNSILADHWNEEELLAEIERLETLVEGELRESNTDFKKTMDKYRKFVSTRRKSLERELKKGPPELRSREHLPTYFDEIGKAKVTFSTRWFDQTPKAPKSEVQVELEIDGKPVEITKAYAYGEFSKWPSPDGSKPPSIAIVAQRKSDGVRLTLGVGFTEGQFQHPNGSPGAINGLFIEGINFFPEGGMQLIGGTAKLEQASTTDGEPIVGSMDLIIARMNEGKPVDEVEGDDGE